MPFSSLSRSGGSGSGGRGGGEKGQKVSHTPFEPPSIPRLDPLVSSMKEPIDHAARARKLHEELRSLVDAHSARSRAELERPFGAGFLDFLKKSKGELINIFAAFACVLLAYQVAGMRRGVKELLDRAEQRERTVDELRRVLHSVSKEEFVAEVAGQCVAAVTDVQSQKVASGSQKGFFQWSFPWDAATSVESEVVMANIVKSIFLGKIHAVVGDSALSDAEKEEKRLSDIQKAMGIERKTLRGDEVNMDAGEMMAAVEERSSKGQDGILVGGGGG